MTSETRKEGRNMVIYKLREKKRRSGQKGSRHIKKAIEREAGKRYKKSWGLLRGGWTS